jgi:NAD(P)-dependent dehydrogenase (short-subunit alcohol dehydrogenase family)
MPACRYQFTRKRGKAMQGLQGKVAIVAGGATGIGAASAERLAAEGAKVVVGDLNREGAEATAARIRAAGGEAVAAQFDLTDEASCQRLIATAVETFGGVDLLHNNGADLSPRTVGRDNDLLGMDVEVWDRTFHTNLYGYAYTCRAILPLLLEHGGGAIVNTTSFASVAGAPERVAYACSKAGINALTRHIASRWGRENIRCNAVAPGLVLSEASLETMPEEFKTRVLVGLRSSRSGRPTDLAGMVAFLLSDDGAWINGQVIHVNGGAGFRD